MGSLVTPHSHCPGAFAHPVWGFFFLCGNFQKASFLNPKSTPAPALCLLWFPSTQGYGLRSCFKVLNCFVQMEFPEPKYVTGIRTGWIWFEEESGMGPLICSPHPSSPLPQWGSPHAHTPSLGLCASFPLPWQSPLSLLLAKQLLRVQDVILNFKPQLFRVPGGERE